MSHYDQTIPFDPTLAHTGDTALIAAANTEMQAILHPAIYSHTVRVVHLATHLAPHLAEKTPGANPDSDAVAVAALFHDAGTADQNDGEQRFELEGADAALRFLANAGWSPDRSRPVWEAIALHTSPGIAERFSPLCRVLRTAVLVDLGRITPPVALSDPTAQELSKYPRLDIDRVLPDAVLTQVLRHESARKAPASSWPGVLLAQHRHNMEQAGSADTKRDGEPPRASRSRPPTPQRTGVSQNDASNPVARRTS